MTGQTSFTRMVCRSSFFAKWFGLRLKREHRVTYADWTDMLMRRANSEGWRVFYLRIQTRLSGAWCGCVEGKVSQTEHQNGSWLLRCLIEFLTRTTFFSHPFAIIIRICSLLEWVCRARNIGC